MMQAGLISALARHVGTFIAGVLVAHGVVGEGDTELVIGVVTALCTLAGAVYAKTKK